MLYVRKRIDDCHATINRAGDLTFAIQSPANTGQGNSDRATEYFGRFALTASDRSLCRTRGRVYLTPNSRAFLRASVYEVTYELVESIHSISVRARAASSPVRTLTAHTGSTVAVSFASSQLPFLPNIPPSVVHLAARLMDAQRSRRICHRRILTFGNPPPRFVIRHNFLKCWSRFSLRSLGDEVCSQGAQMSSPGYEPAPSHR